MSALVGMPHTLTSNLAQHESLSSVGQLRSKISHVPRSQSCCRIFPVASTSGRPVVPSASSPSSQGRRTLLTGGAAVLATLALPKESQGAIITPPPGFRLHQDRLDGYYFFYPEDWLPVTSSGNDIFYRNPFNVNENLFVDISSPSSSTYSTVKDLGPPERAAERTLSQYLEELMSTRLGVKRTGEVVSSSERMGPDDKLYYDVQVEMRSYASRNQLAVSQRQVADALELEWDRRYLTVLGVANKRLYEFRLQTQNTTYERNKEALETIAQSFRCKEVAA